MWEGNMNPSSMHYFPVTPLFMVLLFVAFAVLVALIEFGAITYAYEKMGVGRRYILGILLLSLLGSAVNIPLAELPAKDYCALNREKLRLVRSVGAQ